MENVVKAGVSILIFNRKNQLLVGIRKGSHGAGLLSVLGGHIEFCETLNTCCTRELEEEIGVSFDHQYKNIDFSEDFFEHNGIKKHYITLYLAVEDVDSDVIKIKDMELDKCEDWGWVNIADLPTQMFCDTYNVIQTYLDNKTRDYNTV